MHLRKLLLVSMLFFSSIRTAQFSEIVNNSSNPIHVSFGKATPENNLKIITCKSVVSGDKADCGKGQTVLLPPKTIASTQNALIPALKEDPRGYKKLGITLSSHGKPFAVIAKRNNTIEKLRQHPNNKEFVYGDPSISKQPQTIKNIPISKEGIASENVPLVLEISDSEELVVYLQDAEKLKKYINPSNLDAQKLLHQAIANNSPNDIQAALDAGANINEGIAKQPPLLLALISEKYRAAEKLLQTGASPNINYLGKPLLLFLLRKHLLQLAKLALEKGTHLSSSDKQEAIKIVGFDHPDDLNKERIEILKLIGYDIKDNFNDSDLTKNLWYRMLSQSTTNQLAQLFLDNGANPNQFFQINGDSWNPALLVLDNFLQTIEKNKTPNSFYMDKTIKILDSLIEAGADIDLPAKFKNQTHNALSYVLKNYDTSRKVYPRSIEFPKNILDFLLKKKASIDKAIETYVNNIADPNEPSIQKKLNTLLLFAVQENKPKSVKLLLDAGIRSRGDNPALKESINKGYEDIIELLISHGAQ